MAVITPLSLQSASNPSLNNNASTLTLLQPHIFSTTGLKQENTLHSFSERSSSFAVVCGTHLSSRWIVLQRLHFPSLSLVGCTLDLLHNCCLLWCRFVDLAIRLALSLLRRLANLSSLCWGLSVARRSLERSLLR